MDRKDVRILRDKPRTGGVLMMPPYPGQQLRKNIEETEVTLTGTNAEMETIIAGLGALLGSLAVKEAIQGYSGEMSSDAKRLLGQIAELNIVDTKDLRANKGVSPDVQGIIDALRKVDSDGVDSKIG